MLPGTWDTRWSAPARDRDGGHWPRPGWILSWVGEQRVVARTVPPQLGPVARPAPGRPGPWVTVVVSVVSVTRVQWEGGRRAVAWHRQTLAPYGHGLVLQLSFLLLRINVGISAEMFWNTSNSVPQCCPWYAEVRSWSWESPHWPGGRRSCCVATCWLPCTQGRLQCPPRQYCPRSAAGCRATAPSWHWLGWTELSFQHLLHPLDSDLEYIHIRLDTIYPHFTFGIHLGYVTLYLCPNIRHFAVRFWGPPISGLDMIYKRELCRVEACQAVCRREGVWRARPMVEAAGNGWQCPPETAILLCHPHSQWPAAPCTHPHIATAHSLTQQSNIILCGRKQAFLQVHMEQKMSHHSITLKMCFYESKIDHNTNIQHRRQIYSGMFKKISSKYIHFLTCDGYTSPHQWNLD